MQQAQNLSHSGQPNGSGLTDGKGNTSMPTNKPGSATKPQNKPQQGKPMPKHTGK
jgi:hypothetical protein